MFPTCLTREAALGFDHSSLGSSVYHHETSLPSDSHRSGGLASLQGMDVQAPWKLRPDDMVGSGIFFFSYPARVSTCLGLTFLPIEELGF